MRSQKASISGRFPKTTVLVLLLGLTTSVVLAGGSPSGEKGGQASPGPASPPAPAADPSPASPAIGRGLVAFARYCGSCHGPDGDGRGPSARRFVAPATSFLTGVYKCRSTASGALPTDQDLRRSIVDGLPGSGMPPFGALGPLQIDDLVETLKHFSSRFGREAQVPPLAVTGEPANDGQSVSRGAQVYDRLKCATCHGWRGEGGPGAANLRNDDGTSAEVTDFTRKYSLRCGDTADRLYVTIMTGLDGTPMASYAEAVAGSDAWDVVQYILSVRR